MASIIRLTVQQILAPTPSNLQGKGALISQGGSTLAEGTFQALRSAADLAAILPASLSITSLVWASGIVTATVSGTLPAVGQTFLVTIAGSTPAGYNGMYTATVASADTFTYPLTVSPGTETVPGTYTPPGVVELTQMVTSFFGNGTGQVAYVLELGEAAPTTTIAALSAFMTANPLAFYAYVTPRNWDGQAGLLTLLNAYTALTAMTYFFVTTVTTNVAAYPTTLKDTLLFQESPDATSAEFQAAAAMQAALALAPSASNRLTPYRLTFLYGVTPWPDDGNTNAFAAMDAANVNYVTTAAEGGLSTAMLANGKTLDGKPFNYWYAADWLQINLKLNLANAVINGANNKQNPLVYDQPGIDRLQDAAVSTVKTGVTLGCLTGTVTRATQDTSDFLAAVNAGTYAGQNIVNAEPFIDYIGENPSDYGNGVYNGISVGAIPMRNFAQIGVNVSLTDLIAA